MSRFAVLLLAVVGCGKGENLTTEATPNVAEATPVVAPVEPILAPKGVWKGKTAAIGVPGASPHMADHLVIAVVCGTLDDKAQVQFQDIQPHVKVTDERSKPVRITALDANDEKVMQTTWKANYGDKMGLGAGVVTSDRARMQCVVIDRPAPGAEYFDVWIDTEVVGEAGQARFRLPASEWKLKK